MPIGAGIINAELVSKRACTGRPPHIARPGPDRRNRAVLFGGRFVCAIHSPKCTSDTRQAASRSIGGCRRRPHRATSRSRVRVPGRQFYRSEAPVRSVSDRSLNIGRHPAQRRRRVVLRWRGARIPWPLRAADAKPLFRVRSPASSMRFRGGGGCLRRRHLDHGIRIPGASAG